MRAGLPALVAGLALASAGPAMALPELEEPPARRPGFVAAQNPEAGALELLLAVGRPFGTLSLDYGLLSQVAVGLAYDIGNAGFVRAGAHLRVRALRLGAAELGARASLSAVLPRATSGFAARSIAQTADGELGVLLSYAVLDTVAVFGEGTLLAQTDFSRLHSGTFVEALGGVEWAAFGPYSLLGRLGVISGSRGSNRMASVGAGVRF